MKKIILLVIAVIALTAAYIGHQVKSANDLHEYALANNCTWRWQGTMYGDDRDYICK